jgi:hypothetical protein
MNEILNDETKEEILRLISTPGIEVEDIVLEVNLDFDTIMDFLSDEYLKHNFDYGRRICCRF